MEGGWKVNGSWMEGEWELNGEVGWKLDRISNGRWMEVGWNKMRVRKRESKNVSKEQSESS
jgi:hypothetical protein